MDVYESFTDEMLDFLNLVIADRIRWIRKQQNLAPTATEEQTDLLTAEVILEARNINDYFDKTLYTVNGPQLSEKEAEKMKKLLKENYADIIAIVSAYINSKDEDSLNRGLTEVYKEGKKRIGL